MKESREDQTEVENTTNHTPDMEATEYPDTDNITVHFVAGDKISVSETIDKIPCDSGQE